MFLFFEKRGGGKISVNTDHIIAIEPGSPAGTTIHTTSARSDKAYPSLIAVEDDFGTIQKELYQSINKRAGKT